MAILRDRARSGGQYFCEVNKGAINMSTLTDVLNSRYAEGYRLHTALELGGNTVLIFELRGEVAMGR